MNHPIRNILRLKKIATTLVRYGFGGLVSELRLLPVFSTLSRVFTLRRGGRGKSIPERIRLVLEELGPTFIKLGQVASTRADLLPPEWIDEFKKLQDMVPSFPFSVAKRVVEGSLKAPLDEKFLEFEEDPVASASIAQVHYATLPDGTPVAVKVKRPDIETTIDTDISVMYTVAGLLVRHVPAARLFRPLEVVSEFDRVIHKELDLSVEGANATRFKRLFKGDERVQIPGVYWEHTTSEVLTMERISGTPLDEVEKIKAKGLDIKKISTDGLSIFFKQVFDFGFFHADLHPGNIFVRDDGVIIYLDFGIVGRLDRDLRRFLASMLFHLIRRDYRKLALIHKEMGLIEKDVDLGDFEGALSDLAEPIFGRRLEDIDISTLLGRMLQTARRYHVKLQPNLLLLEKSMVIIEGVGRQLYPDINAWAVAKPLIYRWMLKEKASPGPYIEKGREFTGELTSTILDMPGQVHELITTTIKDELKVGFIHQGLDELPAEVSSAGKSVAWGLVAAALIVASAIFAATDNEVGTRVLGLPVISIAGFALSALVTLKLALSKSPRDG